MAPSCHLTWTWSLFLFPPQLRPRPRANALAGLSMSGALACLHTPAAAFPFMGQYQWRPGRSGPGSPRAGAVLGSAFGLCGLWAEPALSHLNTFPAASKGRFANTLAGCSLKPPPLLLSPGEKHFGVVPSQGPWPWACGTARGSKHSSQGLSICTCLFLPPAPSESSPEPEVFRQLLGKPKQHQPGGKGQSRSRGTLGLLLSLLPRGCWDKECLPSTPFLPSSLCQRALFPVLLQCGDSPFQHLPSH